MTVQRKLSAQFENTRRQVRAKKALRSAVLGDDTQNIYSDRLGFYFARPVLSADENGNALLGPTFYLQANPAAAIMPKPGRKVYYKKNDRGIDVIDSSDFDDLVQSGVDPIALEPNDPYRAFRNLYEIVNLNSYSIGSDLLVNVYPWQYHTDDNVVHYFGGTTASTQVDLAASVPTDVDTHRYALLVFNITQHLAAANPLEVYDGTAISLFTDLSINTDLQTCYDLLPTDEIIVPIKAYYLAYGQTKVAGIARDLDVRQFINVPASGGSTITLTSPDGTIAIDEPTPGNFEIDVADASLTVAKASPLWLHSAATAPTTGDDSGDGYVVGSRWINTATDKEYVCADNTLAAAVWVETTASDTGITQLTGDVTAGPGSGSQAATLAASGVAAGSYTNASVTFDAKGRATSASSGTAPVTSVGASSPLSSSGGATPTISISNQSANTILAGPTTGSAAAPTFRAMVTDDLPIAPIAKGGTGQTTKAPAFDALSPTTTQGDIIYHNGTNNARLAKGTALQQLRMNAGATAPEWFTAKAVSIDWQYFSASGTWTKPAGAFLVKVICISGGGGGGSGRRGATATIRFGGGGGAAGTVTMAEFEAGMLSATETVTIDTGGGVGAPAITADSTNGSSGGDGSNTYFGGVGAPDSKLAAIAIVGSGGVGGGVNALGTGGVGNITPSSTFQFYNSSGGNGHALSATSGAASSYGPGSGGGGGGINQANTIGNGAAGGLVTGAYYAGVTGGGGTGGNAAAGGNGGGGTTDGSSPDLFGSGGGGGGSAANVGRAGGNGGTPGGGGGGGSASLNGNNSGAGGNGGGGGVFVISYCYA